MPRTRKKPAEEQNEEQMAAPEEQPEAQADDTPVFGTESSSWTAFWDDVTSAIHRLPEWKEYDTDRIRQWALQYIPGLDAKLKEGELESAMQAITMHVDAAETAGVQLKNLIGYVDGESRAQRVSYYSLLQRYQDHLENLANLESADEGTAGIMFEKDHNEAGCVIFWRQDVLDPEGFPISITVRSNTSVQEVVDTATVAFLARKELEAKGFVFNKPNRVGPHGRDKGGSGGRASETKTYGKGGSPAQPKGKQAMGDDGWPTPDNGDESYGTGSDGYTESGQIDIENGRMVWAEGGQVFVPVGGTAVIEIERCESAYFEASDSIGIKMYSPNAQYPTITMFDDKNGANFASFHNVTDENPLEIGAKPLVFSPPLRVLVKVGKMNKKGTNRYLDFVRVLYDDETL